jgi:hypothetical protein
VALRRYLSAAIDNHIRQGNVLGVVSLRISWSRVVDVNDRALPDVVFGQGGVSNSMPRRDSFQFIPPGLSSAFSEDEVIGLDGNAACLSYLPRTYFCGQSLLDHADEIAVAGITVSRGDLDDRRSTTNRT